MTGLASPFRAVPKGGGGRHVAVVGGGVMGAFTAAHLRMMGASVTLYDPHPMGTGPGASVDTGRSFRVHYGQDEGLVNMAVRSRRLWSEWSVRLGRPLLHPTGKLLVERIEADQHAFESWRTMRNLGLRADRLGAKAVSQEWPGFRANRATVDRLGGVLDPQVVLQGMAGWLAQAQVKRRGEAMEVTANSVRCAEGVHPFDAVVLTSGAWTQRWLNVPMEVTRQQLVYFDAQALGDRLMNLPVFSDLGSGFYAIPTVKDGRIKVANHHPGPPGHPDGDDRKVTPSFRSDARAFLAAHLPELAQADVAWEHVCFYSGTADRDFILDRTADGMIVGAGFSGHGFKFGPLVGRLLAQLAMSQSTDVDLTRFSMRRSALSKKSHTLAV